MDRQSIDFSLSPGACILGAAALLILPLRWIFGAVFAAAFHEMCHYLALRICRIRIYKLSVGPGGAILETEPMDRLREFLCALAGPLGSFFLVLLHRWFPVTAVCAGIQGIYNLLPLDNLDGGRMLRCALGARISEMAGKCVRTIVLFAGLYGFFYLKLGIWVLIASFFLIRRAAGRKIPCKDGQLRVQ